MYQLVAINSKQQQMMDSFHCGRGRHMSGSKAVLMATTWGNKDPFLCCNASAKVCRLAAGCMTM